MTDTRAGGDAEEFTRVYRAERNRLRRVAYLMTGQRAVAEELVHDAFVRLHHKWDTVEVPAAYLRTTLVRLCLTWRDRTAIGRRPGRREPCPRHGRRRCGPSASPWPSGRATAGADA